jgi:hypothetical protein
MDASVVSDPRAMVIAVLAIGNDNEDVLEPFCSSIDDAGYMLHPETD